jgi:hypothetical protein
MRTLLATPLLIVATVLATSCGISDDSFEITGMVRFSAVEDGCWSIRGDDGRTYEPVNLPAEYLVDSLRVWATVEHRQGIHRLPRKGKNERRRRTEGWCAKPGEFKR